jgi:hypothetical protein
MKARQGTASQRAHAPISAFDDLAVCPKFAAQREPLQARLLAVRSDQTGPPYSTQSKGSAVGAGGAAARSGQCPEQTPQPAPALAREAEQDAMAGTRRMIIQ